MRMTELGQHVLGAAEGRGTGRRRAVVVAVSVGMRGAVAGREFGRPLLLAAEELGVTAAQDLLIAADDGGAGQIGVRVKAPALGDQALGVDDDLALAAEIGRQGGVHHPLQTRALGLLRRGPAQDQTGTADDLRTGRARIRDYQLDHHVAAGPKAHGGEIKRRREPTVARGAAARQGDLALTEGHVLAFADGQGDAQPGRGGDAVVVSHGEHRAPAALAGRDQRQTLRRRHNLHRRRGVGDGVDAVQRRRPRPSLRRIDAVEERGLQGAAGHPFVARARKRERCAGQHDHRRNAGLGLETQGPFETRALRGARVQLRLVAHGQAGVSGRIDAQVLGGQMRYAWRNRPLGGGRESDRAMLAARPEGEGCDDDQGGGPEDQDRTARPVRNEGLRRAGGEAVKETGALQTLQDAETLRIGEQEFGAVLHVGAGAVETMCQPVAVEAAGTACGEDRDDRSAGDEHEQARDGAAEDPGQSGDYDHDRRGQQQVVEQPPAPGRASPGGDQVCCCGHGTTPRERRVASQRSHSSSRPISTASQGLRSSGAGSKARPPVRGE
jgi:hypothetical protein